MIVKLDNVNCIILLYLDKQHKISLKRLFPKYNRIYGNTKRVKMYLLKILTDSHCKKLCFIIEKIYVYILSYMFACIYYITWFLFAFRNLETHSKLGFKIIYQCIILLLCDSLTSSKPLTINPTKTFLQLMHIISPHQLLPLISLAMR